MIKAIVSALICCLSGGAVFAAEKFPQAHWDFETINADEIHGDVRSAKGVRGRSMVLDGHSLIEGAKSTELTQGADGFTALVWVNSYALSQGQQMVLAKNRYSLNERQWGVMLDKDNRFRLYVWQGKWNTVDAKRIPVPGKWYQIAVVVTDGSAELYVNGELQGRMALDDAIPNTKALVTVGGVNDNGRIWQNWYGAIDEVYVYHRAFSKDEIKTQYKPVNQRHEVPRVAGGGFELWDADMAIPRSQELTELKGVTFHVIKPRVPEVDEYNWLHGVALEWHKGQLYTSYGHNKGDENTASEEARGQVSEDGGKTWSEVFTIDSGRESGLAVSHGVFLSHQDRLWAFHGAFHGKLQDVHTIAYILDEDTDRWRKKGKVLEGGFWPTQRPWKMEDGNWIMAGFIVGQGNPAAVAISQRDDLMHWELVVVPKMVEAMMWGESSVIVDGPRVINVARYGERAQALVSISEDHGRTWTESRPSNMPMVTSKPYTGTLSTGQRYLVATTTADSGSRRFPLTIAVSQPGENRFSRIFRIRDAVHEGPGESHPAAALAYPYAVEKNGRFYVGYSNDGGRGGNRNSAEFAIIPLEALQVD